MIREQSIQACHFVQEQPRVIGSRPAIHEVFANNRKLCPMLKEGVCTILPYDKVPWALFDRVLPIMKHANG